MHVLVLGAGLAGVTSAWYLKQAGFDVTVVDRQPAPAMETSFANGGQISVSHPEPWANPAAPLTILRWLGNDAAPLSFRPHANWSQWRWALGFLRECLPWRTRRNAAAIAALARYSRDELRTLRSAIGLDYPHSERGILHLFFDHRNARGIADRVDELARYGIVAEACDASRCVAIEPALAQATRAPVAGIFAADDESGDAHAFVVALAARLQHKGVRFLFNTPVTGIDRLGSLVEGVRCADAAGQETRLRASSYVMCMGSYSPILAATLGERLPIYPVKGYSVSLPIVDPQHAPQVSLTDESRRIVCSTFEGTLRVAGTAELNGYDLTLDEKRCRTLIEWAETNFPGATESAAAESWCGLRPATPSNRPLIGKSGMLNLYYNTGHGTLGWTLACGSARALAEIMSGRHPQAAFPFLGGRFD